MVPAQECLGRGDPLVGQVHERLVEHLELVALQGEREILRHLQALDQRRPHRGLEANRAAPAPARRVGGHAGVPQKVHRHPAPVLGHRHPDARRGQHLLAAHENGLGQARHEPPRHLRRLVRALEPLEQHRELAVSHPRAGVARAQAGVEAARHLQQHLVPGRRSEHIVHGAHVLQVHDQDGHRLPGPAGAGEGVGRAVLEEHPGGQPGEVVVEGPLAGRPVVRRVGRGPQGQHHSMEWRGLRRALGHPLDRHQARVAVHHRPLPAAGLALRGGQHQRRRPAVRRGHEVEQKGVGQALRVVTEEARDRRRGVADDPALADHQHGVGRVVHERAEPALALLEGAHADALPLRSATEVAQPRNESFAHPGSRVCGPTVLCRQRPGRP